MSPPRIVAHLRGFGERVAVIHDGAEVRYARLADLVAASARRLGTGRRLVAVAARNDIDSLVAYLGALEAGCVVLLTGTVTEELVATYDPDVVIDGGSPPRVRRGGSAHTLHPELALLLSTSGSTGSPKLVRLSYRNVLSNATAIAEYLEIDENDRAATTLPLFYCYGLSVVHSHLLCGASLLLTDRSVLEPEFWHEFQEHRATSFAAVPYTFDLLDRVGFERMSLPHLRYVTQAGGRLAPDHVRHYARLSERSGWRFYVMYGQTEATARMAYLPPSLAATHPDCIGIPIPGGSFTLEPVDEGDELVYHGPNVMMGYAHTPTDLAQGPTLTHLRTGDLACRTDDGLYRVTGRRNRYAKIFGLRIDLQRIESGLATAGYTACCTDDDETLVVAIEASTHPADAEWNPRPSPQPRPSPPRVNGHNTSDTSGLPTPPPTRPASHDASTATDVPTASPTHVDGHRAPSTNGLPVHSPTRVDSADTPRANGLPTPSPTRVDSPGAPGASGLPNPSPTHANGHGASSASGLLAPWPTRVDGPGAPDASGLPAPSPTRVDNHGAPESSGLPAPSPTHVDSHGAPETSGLPAPSQTRGGSHDAPGASGKPAPSRVESHVASGWGGLLVHVLADFRARCADRGRAVLSPRSGGPGARCRSGIAVAREVARLSGLPVSAVRVCVVASIPRLPNGKPDYPAIRRLSGVREVQTADVRALFGQALGIDARSIGGSATFADLGGDSLTYVGLSMRLEHALGQLPVQWPTMTVAELEALPRRHHRFGRSVDTGTLLRALAIVAVVGSHIGLFVLWGGAHVLLAVAGFNFARFAVTAAPAAARLRRTLRSVAFIAVPTALWVLATLPFGDYYGWQNVLLLNKILGPHDSPTAGHLWFVEVLVYLVLAAALLLRLPVADRLERLSPFWFASGLLALSLIFRYRSFDLYAPQDVPFSPLVCWFFLLGWAAAKATTAWHRLLLSILAVADIPGYFNETDRELMILAGILLLVWLPSVRMPALLAGPVALVADAALFTYLLHWQVYPLFGQHHLLALMGSLAAGMAAAKVMAWARAAVASAPGSAGPVDGPNLSLRLLGQFRDQDISRNRLASKVIE